MQLATNDRLLGTMMHISFTCTWKKLQTSSTGGRWRGRRRTRGRGRERRMNKGKRKEERREEEEKVEEERRGGAEEGRREGNKEEVDADIEEQTGADIRDKQQTNRRPKLLLHEITPDIISLSLSLTIARAWPPCAQSCAAPSLRVHHACVAPRSATRHQSRRRWCS